MSDIKKEIADAQDELEGLLEGKIARLKAQRKYVKRHGLTVPNEKKPCNVCGNKECEDK